LNNYDITYYDNNKYINYFDFLKQANRYVDQYKHDPEFDKIIFDCTKKSTGIKLLISKNNERYNSFKLPYSILFNALDQLEIHYFLYITEENLNFKWFKPEFLNNTENIICKSYSIAIPKKNKTFAISEMIRLSYASNKDKAPRNIYKYRILDEDINVKLIENKDFSPNGKITSIMRKIRYAKDYYEKFHSIDLPSRVEYAYIPEMPCFYNRYWYNDGHLHRNNGPAIITATNSTEEKFGDVIRVERCWYKNGHRHNEDGPAVIIKIYDKRNLKLLATRSYNYLENRRVKQTDRKLIREANITAKNLTETHDLSLSI